MQSLKQGFQTGESNRILTREAIGESKKDAQKWILVVGRTDRQNGMLKRMFKGINLGLI
jgi:hypothetical protein